MRLNRLFIVLFLMLPGCSLVTKTLTSPIRSFKYTFREHKPNSRERYGKVFYLDGAGALGLGEDTIPTALRAAGFQGDVEYIAWSSHTGPLGDQMIRANAHWKAEALTKNIIDYHKHYPNAPIYLIGLSAGTGVGVWAVEHLPANIHVNGMVLLSSSLSMQYNLVPCLRHVTHKMFVVYSPYDNVLKTFIPVMGTIDGEYFAEPAGLAGMHPPKDLKPEDRALYKEKLVNVAWQPKFERLGYTGKHTDAISYGFIRHEIAPRLQIGHYAQTETAPAGKTK
jgi:hypothetical protein